MTRIEAAARVWACRPHLCDGPKGRCASSIPRRDALGAAGHVYSLSCMLGSNDWPATGVLSHQTSGENVVPPDSNTGTSGRDLRRGMGRSESRAWIPSVLRLCEIRDEGLLKATTSFDVHLLLDLE